MSTKALVALLGLCAVAAAATVHLTPASGALWARKTAGIKHTPLLDGPDKVFGFIPATIGRLIPDGPPLTWSTPCFERITAHATRNEDGRGAAVVFQVGLHAKDHARKCESGFLNAFTGAIDISFFKDQLKNQTVHFREPDYTDAQLWDLFENGIRIFEFPDKFSTTISEVVATVRLLLGSILGYNIIPDWAVADNLAFIKNHMNYVMEPRNITKVVIPKSEVHPGDMIILTRLAGVSPIVMWAMGTHVGHQALVVEIDGQLSVCESNNGGAIYSRDTDCGTWEAYLDRVEKRDYNVAILPLAPKYRKLFNNDKAVKYLKSILGLPYGYHNMIAGWIDTPEKNYPPKVTSDLWQILMTVVDWLLQDLLQAGDMGDGFTAGWNKRLGTTGLRPAELFQHAAKKGISFGDLVSMPELDKWEYDNGKNFSKGPSIICCTLVSATWKAAGLFEEYKDKIEATEFTLYDTYSINIFDMDYKNTRPEQCKQADPDLPWCQILGRHRMVLEPEWGTVPITAHMKEKCESVNPDYIRTPGC